MNPPVTTQIMDLFEKYGVDPHKNQDLVWDLMNYVYDEMDRAIDLTYGPKVTHVEISPEQQRKLETPAGLVAAYAVHHAGADPAQETEKGA